MNVTVKKTLNGIEIHPAYTRDGEEVPMKILATYKFEVPELGYLDRRHLNLVPFTPEAIQQQLEQLLYQAQQIIDKKT